MSPTVRCIDPAESAQALRRPAAEVRWDRVWERARHLPLGSRPRPREETFVVDTPPPTVSGSLHIGHVFSYTHTDVHGAPQADAGQNIFYPMGWDDNGLPTERRVQNYFHVRCDPHEPYERGARDRAGQREGAQEAARGWFRAPTSSSSASGSPPRTRRPSRTCGAGWGCRSTGPREYATIDERPRLLAQLSFLDLCEKGHVYNSDAPTMWDVDFQTAVAQAEMEDRMEARRLPPHRVRRRGFSDRGFVIATTRPELLPACVGVTAHIPTTNATAISSASNAVTPLFRVPVPIFPSELADPEKGTGILMVCTFGDATDVEWWREHGGARAAPARSVATVRLLRGELRQRGLPERRTPTPPTATTPSSPARESSQARKAIVELLRDPAGSANRAAHPSRASPSRSSTPSSSTRRAIGPLELVPTRQWFVRLLDKKEALLVQGRRGAPGTRPSWGSAIRDWTEGLSLDWCVSRASAYFGVPIPVWYPLDATATRITTTCDPAGQRDQLPVDPTIDTPPGFDASQRDQAGRLPRARKTSSTPGSPAR